MKEMILKTAIYTFTVFFGAYIFIEVGTELIVQIAMLIDGVSDRSLLTDNSLVTTISIYFFIPEVIFGAIGGWYLAEWFFEKTQGT